MGTRPLLIFPQPEQAARKKKVGGPSNVHFPSAREQAVRLGPKFRRLARVLETERAALRLDPGQEPERVLVLETIGGVDEFFKAIKRTPGLEWLGEWEEDAIAPDDDFYSESERDKPLRGRVYLLMFNQRALEEMLSLWNRYRRSPNQPFSHGFNKWRNVFAQLKDVRLWDERDRLDQSLLQVWEGQLAARREDVIFKAELWFSASETKRRTNQGIVEQILREEGGRLLGQVVIPEIAFHALAGQIPARAARRIVSSQQTRLVSCDRVMFFRPLGQSAVPSPTDTPAGRITERNLRAPERLEPVVALLDGLPAVNHELLAGRIILDDPDGWNEEYAAHERVHGTMMASIIAHGELDAVNPQLATPIYSRPILKPDRAGWRGSTVETIPEDIIPEDLIQRAITRIFSAAAGIQPVAPSVRIVTLAIGDPSVSFVRSMSPLARLLDWLAWRYQILVLVSAGNRTSDIELGVIRGTLGTLAPLDLERATFAALEATNSDRRLLCPAEAINALTIGAIHADSSTPGPLGDRINPYISPGLPSPISALGLGYRRAVKPDLLLPGGRQLFRQKLGNTHAYETLQLLTFQSRSPGHRAASPAQGANLAATRFYCGTSNSTALGARYAAETHELLRTLRDQPGGDLLEDRYTAVLLKTMLVHGCSWDQPMTIIGPILEGLPNRPAVREYAPRFLGYGELVPERVRSCTPERVTLIGCGRLSEDGAHIYRVPLPPSLGGQLVWRKLTITLSWLTPINPLDRNYRRAALWFSPPAEELLVTRSQIDWQMAQRGTVQHEILEGDQATAFADGSALSIQVNCRSEGGAFEEEIPYSIAVSLEVAQGIAIPIYEEVRARLRVGVPIETANPNH